MSDGDRIKTDEIMDNAPEQSLPPAVPVPHILMTQPQHDVPLAPLAKIITDTAGSDDENIPSHNFATRLGSFFGRASHKERVIQEDVQESPESEAAASHIVTSYAQVLPRLAGQADEVVYSLAFDGLPLPPGGLAYIIESPAAASSDPVSVSDAVSTSSVIVAYIDAYGRVFSTGSIQTMPPARMPEIQFMRYENARLNTEPIVSDEADIPEYALSDSSAPDAETARNGCIEVAVSRTKTSRLAEYVESPSQTFAIVGARVNFGIEPAGLSLAVACAVAFLSLWLFPRHEGISLASVNVKDVLGHLRSSDLFDTIDTFIDDAIQSQAHPLLIPPGLITYTAYDLRAAGLEHLNVSDVAAVSAHGPSILGNLGAGNLFSALRSALESSGIQGLMVLGGDEGGGLPLPGEPVIRLIRTVSYANTFYVLFDPAQVTPEGAQKLLEAESILNRFLLMIEELDRIGAVQTATWGQVMELDAWLIDRIGELAFAYLDDTVTREDAPMTGSDQLDLRMMFARGCERLRLPYRLEYSFRFDEKIGELVVDVECPTADIMPRLVWVSRDPAGAAGEAPALDEDIDISTTAWRRRSPAECAAMASRYAMHLSVVIAAVAFWAGSEITQVIVNCWHGRDDAGSSNETDVYAAPLTREAQAQDPLYIATARFDRATFTESLASAAQREAFEADPFAFIGAFQHTYSLDAAGGLGSVKPLRSLDDPLLHPADAHLKPELDTRPLTEHGMDILRVRRICDLGIYENAQRGDAADEVVMALKLEGKEAAIDALHDVHDRTENRLMREACLRAEDGIASGMYTDGSDKALHEALTDIYGLQSGLRSAYRLLQTDVASASKAVEDMLTSADEQRWFADSPTRRYRYFDSYAARVIYELRCPESNDGRELRLCSDEYYLCHYRMAALLSDSLDHAEDAIAHAQRCVQLAPSVASSYLRLARCYFCVFDYMSEIDTLKAMLRVAWSPTDIGMALYWLGYAYCLTDKSDIGMACYQRCTDYDQNLADIAVSEAADFLHKRAAETSHTYTKHEIEVLLAREAIDLTQADRNTRYLQQAAGAVLDAGSFGLARNLLGAAEAMLHDDAIPPVLDSLAE